jgi:hypothetical protein
MLPQAATVTIGLRWRAGDDSPYHAHEAPAVAEGCLRPAQVLVRDSRHPSGGDTGKFCPAQWRRQPRCKTRVPAPTPDSAAQHHPLGDPTARWTARSRVAPACMPLDGDNSTPDGEDFNPHPVVLIIGHVADHRGSAQKEQRGGEEKEQPRQGVREGIGAAVAQGGGGIVMWPPLPSLSLWGNSCGGGTGVSPETTDKEQTTIKS